MEFRFQAEWFVTVRFRLKAELHTSILRGDYFVNSSSTSLVP